MKRTSWRWEHCETYHLAELVELHFSSEVNNARWSCKLFSPYKKGKQTLPK